VRDVLDELYDWWGKDEPVGMVTVVDTWRSAPRPAGATMLVGPDGTAVGSISGGCVEGAAYELARQVVEEGEPALTRYGISDEDAFSVGLTCGGLLDVYAERIDQQRFPELGEVAAEIRAGHPVAVVTCVKVPDSGDPERRKGRHLIVWPDRTKGSLGLERLDQAVTDDARGLLASGRTGVLRYGYDGERRLDDLQVFVASYAAPPRMIVFGAIDFAAAVARIGTFLGYRVTVCDARPVFATRRRFPDADEVVVAWPHKYLRAEADAGRVDERTVVCVLTHDPKFDAPALEVALRLPLAYVGAMGSRRTHDDRLERLRALDLTEQDLAKLASPIGLDLGARTPEETAVSIAAEIIAARWGGRGERLAALDGRIHHDRA
jgi:xanthine dehydrogenase accessory factor